MKNTTVLNALMIAFNRMVFISSARGLNGIMTGNDYYALKYQNLQRKARKFEAYLRNNLEEMEG